MSITETNTVDGMGISEDKTGLALLISDHLDWEKEYEHLLLLQDKINAYISFIETQQYQSIYPAYVFTNFVIEIHFKYEIVESCSKFIKAVSEQIKPLNISIRAIALDE